MSRITPNIILLVVFLLPAMAGLSQSGVSVHAQINRDKILIGEPIELKLEASLPSGADAGWFPLDSLVHFDFIDKGKIDTVDNGDTQVLRQTLLITSFDSGRWAVPSLHLSLGNKDYLTDSLPVSVAYSNVDPNADYHDIKDIIEVEYTGVKYLNWILLGIGLLSLALAVYFLRKKAGVRRPADIKGPVSKLSPLQEALDAIDQLQQKGYAEPVRTKLFHAELNDILRQYVYRKTGMRTMEKTSGELLLQLKGFNISADEFSRLAQVLRMNDAVKFAKYQPAAEENREAIETIKKSVVLLDSVLS